MERRITDKHLDGMVARLNDMTGSPKEYMTDGKINVGHFHVSHAYGGVCLVRTCNESGGESTPICSGHVTKRELYDQLYAYIRGIEFAKGY